MTLIASVFALSPERAVEIAVSISLGILLQAFLRLVAGRCGWVCGCVIAAGVCRTCGCRARRGCRGCGRSRGRGSQTVRIAADPDHLFQFAELRQLRNELRAVGRIERVLI